MTPTIIKVTGFSAEVEHYINLSFFDRIDLKKLPNTTAYRFYLHSPNSELDIVISHTEAQRVREALEEWI